MQSTLTEDKFLYLPLDKARRPTASMVSVYRDRWWAVHPDRGLLMYRGRRLKLYGGISVSPQCNPHKSIAEQLCPPFAEVMFLDLVFVPIAVYDFDYIVTGV
jgi:hypothetical protein